MKSLILAIVALICVLLFITSVICHPDDSISLSDQEAEKVNDCFKEIKDTREEQEDSEGRE